MEKTWETFWATGSVSDYLIYRSDLEISVNLGNGQEQKEQKRYGTVHDSDGHGFDGHACQ